ncbi:C40 family peptidase [Corynebacterium spheniscorum]|uniref:Cell wall-associated hydrolase, NlpC family n=1 Tax=Corynebacterium spheniscorum TaxID=185761 RepID=A0A1I2RJW4_9CORY|nr:C40 family peptidase [Corynebacterium spheniscorum]KAA8722461.1 NlpC/P60 family protein [Corynebacterium spheniscorum]SFG39769.1 Cell wall-associated hydrolase, NlpC family [Corynebacterium spheniscorum]
MAKHRRHNPTAARRVAQASAIAVGATALVNAPANAAEVVVPNTEIRFQVDGIENIPGIQNVAGIDQWIPSLSAQGAVPAAPGGSATYAAPAASVGQAIVDAARSRIGAPYGWGAAGPNVFDCSGLTSWAYQQVGKSIPRTSQGQAYSGTPVAISDLQPGDIVAYYGGASHVAIYAGNGMIIDALNEGSTVGERPLNYMPIHSAVRF